jgi:hypothetical protein
VEAFDRMIAVNLRAAFLLMRAFVPGMLARGRGHIVTIGSVAGRQAFPSNGAYSASKFGVRGLHAVLAAELRGTGVRATFVEPAATDTPLWDASTARIPACRRASDAAAGRRRRRRAVRASRGRRRGHTQHLWWNGPDHVHRQRTGALRQRALPAQLQGKCERLHGHRYVVELALARRSWTGGHRVRLRRRQEAPARAGRSSRPQQPERPAAVRHDRAVGGEPGEVLLRRDEAAGCRRAWRTPIVYARSGRRRRNGLSTRSDSCSSDARGRGAPPRPLPGCCGGVCGSAPPRRRRVAPATRGATRCRRRCRTRRGGACTCWRSRARRTAARGWARTATASTCWARARRSGAHPAGGHGGLSWGFVNSIAFGTTARRSGTARSATASAGPRMAADVAQLDVPAAGAGVAVRRAGRHRRARRHRLHRDGGRTAHHRRRGATWRCVQARTR